MGLPLATIAFTQWWLATDKERHADVRTRKRATGKRRTYRHEDTQSRFPIATRRMIAAGVAAGLLPLVHAHSFVVVMAMAGCLALIQIRWREWFAFFAVASAIAIPQLLWSTLNSAVDASSFFAWEVGWDHGKENPVWFWFKNTGLFIPLIFAAVLMKRDGYVVPRRAAAVLFAVSRSASSFRTSLKWRRGSGTTSKCFITGGWHQLHSSRCCWRNSGVRVQFDEL